MPVSVFMSTKNKPIVFYDAVYQKIIIFDPLIQELIFTKEFQRLKHIKQLGTLSLLLNSSAHTRFSHSIGVYYLIAKLLSKKRFAYLSDIAKKEVAVAGLLHDLGHGPFSHIFEKITPTFRHEDYSAKIIASKKGDIYPILQKYRLNIDRINDLITKKTVNDWGQTLISQQFDLDRLDYLMRDSYFLGLKGLSLSTERLLDNIIFYDHKLVFYERVILDLESYLIFRFYIHKTFFWNAENIFYDNVFISIFQRLYDLSQSNYDFGFGLGKFTAIVQRKTLSLSNLLQLDDHDLFVFFRQIQKQSQDVTLLKLINVLLNAPFNKPFVEKPQDVQKQIKLMQQQKLDPQYFVYSSNLSMSIYEKDQDEILLLDQNNNLQPLSKKSLFFNFTRSYSKNITVALDFREYN